MLGGDRLVDIQMDPVVGVALGGVDRLGVSVVDTLIDLPLRQDHFNPVVVTSEGELTGIGVHVGDGSGLSVAEVGLVDILVVATTHDDRGQWALQLSQTAPKCLVMRS